VLAWSTRIPFVAPVVAALAIVASPVSTPSAGAITKNYANFRVTVTGTQTTAVGGTLVCASDDTAVPATGNAKATFSTAPRVLQFSRIGGVVGVDLPGAHAGATTLNAHGSLLRSTSWISNGKDPATCADGQQAPGCGNIKLNHFLLWVQSGKIGGVSLTIRALPSPLPDCDMPGYAFPALVPPSATVGLVEATEHVTYSARMPAAMLDPHKREIAINGVARLTYDFKTPGHIEGHEITKLTFTMHLTRVR
jgi:hypothetical protein